MGHEIVRAGLQVVQVISTKDENYARYCASSDFIRAHIFPGGHLPCRAEMDAVATANGLSRADCIDIGRGQRPQPSISGFVLRPWISRHCSSTSIVSYFKTVFKLLSWEPSRPTFRAVGLRG